MENPKLIVLRRSVEQETGFTNLQTIEFYGFEHLLTKVVAVGFWHGAIARQDKDYFPFMP